MHLELRISTINLNTTIDYKNTLIKAQLYTVLLQRVIVRLTVRDQHAQRILKGNSQLAFVFSNNCSYMLIVVGCLEIIDCALKWGFLKPQKLPSIRPWCMCGRLSYTTVLTISKHLSKLTYITICNIIFLMYRIL